MSTVATATALAILFGIGFSGCAITSGSTFSSAVLADIGDGDTESEDPNPENDPDEALTIRTDPSGATVWINNKDLGTTPFGSSELDPGRYRLRLEKEGYYEEIRWIEVPSNGSLVLEIDLELIVGYLRVQTEPADAEITVDGDAIRGGYAELPIGRHTLRVQKFGFETTTRRIEIEENRTTYATVKLATAPFRVSNVSLSKNVFNPENPGGLGSIMLSFEVTAPGLGTLRVLDPSGQEYESISLPPFDTWSQRVRWPRQGSSAPGDGEYTLLLELNGDDGRDEESSRTVLVDSTLVVRPRLVWHGIPGLLYAPTTDPLPAATYQVSLAGAGVATTIDNQPVSRFPLRIGARVGLGSALELGLHGGFTANSETTDDRLSAGAALVWTPTIATGGPFAVNTGVIVGGTYRTPDSSGLYTGPDTLTNFPGIFVAVPVSLSLGAVSMVASPHYQIAPAPVSYGDTPPGNAFTQFVYGRVGLSVDVGQFSGGISAAFRSEPIAEQIALDLPFAAGAELHWIFREIPVVFGAFAAGEFESLRDFYVMGGATLSVIF